MKFDVNDFYDFYNLYDFIISTTFIRFNRFRSKAYFSLWSQYLFLFFQWKKLGKICDYNDIIKKSHSKVCITF